MHDITVFTDDDIVCLKMLVLLLKAVWTRMKGNLLQFHPIRLHTRYKRLLSMNHRHFTTNHFKSSQQERSKPSTEQHVYRDGVRDLLPNLQPRSAVSSTAVLQTHVLRELPGDALAVHGEPRTPDNVSAVPSHHAAVGGENPRDPAGRRGHF